MNILLIQKPTINLTLLKKGLSDAQQQTIISIVDKHYVKLTEVEESLVYAAYLYAGLEVKDIQDVLRNLPLDCMKIHNYTFLIACDWDVAFELGTKTDLQVMGKHVQYGYLGLVTGDLKQWYQAITNNLDSYNINTREILIEIMGMLKLPVLFEKFERKYVPDGTFYLEKK